MSKNSVFDLIAQFLGRQNTIPVPMPFVRILGDYTSAAFLAQCIYWGDRTDDAEGWFYKSHDEWAAELELSSDQVRRCVKTCTGMVEVKRAGIPARNYYRVDQEGVTAALQKLASETRSVTSRSGETQQLAVDKPNDKTLGNPTASRSANPISNKGTKPTSEPTTEQTQSAAGAAERASGSQGEGQTPPQAPMSDQTPQASQANVGETEAEGLDTVPPAGSKASPSAQRLMAVYNRHRRALPAAEALTPGREKALKRLLGQFGGPDSAAAALADATQEVAADEFWQGKGWGLDNLLPKIAQKAEAWRARALLTTPTDPANPPAVAFEVGQRVSYKRDQYTVEAVTDRHIDLFDERNGSSRITFASSDFAAIKALGVQK